MSDIAPVLDQLDRAGGISGLRLSEDLELTRIDHGRCKRCGEAALQIENAQTCLVSSGPLPLGSAAILRRDA